MFVRIGNTPRDYAWGSPTALPELLGTPVTGAPQAELWLGAHAGSPSRILEPDRAGGARDLREWIERDPERALGRSGTAAGDAGADAGDAGADAPADGHGRRPGLPFLLKVLAAAAPLSLQAHPTTEQARAGFAAENAAGVPLDAPERNYRDASAKPELVVALSERFEALCGFRPLAATRALLTELVDAAEHRGLTATRIGALRDSLTDAEGLHLAVGRILRGTPREADRAPGVDGDPTGLVAEVVAAAEAAVALVGRSDEPADAREDEPGAAIETVLRLADAYPGDPGIALSLLLNRVSLRAGEALWLPAGNIHAYLEGVGVELMASSDNVLRGGLTPKHVDAAELLRVLSFEPQEPPLLPRIALPGGVTAYRPPVPDFELLHVEASGVRRTGVQSGRPVVPLRGPAIVLAVAGAVRVSGESSAVELGRGEAAYATPDETTLTFSGEGRAFVATVGRP